VNVDQPIYRWRRMSPEQRRAALVARQRLRLPWHGPPHYVGETGYYLLTAACYEHRPLIGRDADRLAAFEADLLATVRLHAKEVFAWVVLPNHYHVLANAPEIEAALKELGLLHGRTSYRWNGEEHERGRQVWHRATETEIKSEGHYWATLNYVLHNAVRHGYVERWQDWPFSNAADYLSAVGREVAEKRWREYPVLDYGKDWDPPEL
jgi:putative transposase